MAGCRTPTAASRRSSTASSSPISLRQAAAPGVSTPCCAPSLDRARVARVASRKGGPMASDTIRVGNVEILHLSDGMLEFDLCNFFPTIPEAEWGPYEQHLHDHKVRFNLGSYLIRSEGRTILVDTGLGPRPADTPDVPWGELLRDFSANGVRPDEIDMVVMTHLHRDHVGWNLVAQGGKHV